MTTAQQIEEMFPLVSYEEERAKSGCVLLGQEREHRELCSGVTYTKRLCKRGDGRMTALYLTRIEPDAQAQITVSACEHGTLKHVKQHAEEFAGNVFFAMNAGYFHFFNNGDRTPYGIQIVQGEVRKAPGLDKVQYSSNFFGITFDGMPLIADTERYFAELEGKLRCAVGGGLRLIKQGAVTLHNDASVAPRTAVGITKDGAVILLCADGRSKRSAGLSYADLIDIYLQLDEDMAELLNLDGGGSTCAVLRDENGGYFVDNVPSGPPTPDQPAQEPFLDTQARPVADAILIAALQA